ncbi:hypothetical protein [Nocardia sp. NPDC127526]|uniref:hypothetical protein n=1 Tax=Nocardia sp. NPDC127526 TaxID=3345393 RepID=UPI0036357E78
MFGNKHTNPWAAQTIIERVERENRRAIGSGPPDPAAVEYAVRGLWSCYADPGELTTAQAHTAMQWHLGCGVDRCLVRRRARAVLVAAGRMVLDGRAAQPPARRRKSVFAMMRVAVFGYGAVFLGGRHVLR